MYPVYYPGIYTYISYVPCTRLPTISPGHPAVYYLDTPTVYYPGIYIYHIYLGMYHVPGYPRYITRVPRSILPGYPHSILPGYLYIPYIPGYVPCTRVPTVYYPGTPTVYYLGTGNLYIPYTLGYVPCTRVPTVYYPDKPAVYCMGYTSTLNYPCTPTIVHHPGTWRV